MSPKNSRLELRLEPDLLDRIDEWREPQAPHMSRAEAVRTLLDRSLPRGRRGFAPVQLSEGERLILAAIASNAEERAEFLDLATGEHSWMLRRQRPQLFSNQSVSPSVVDETYDILDMWVLLEGDLYDLGSEQKKKLVDSLDTDVESLRFPGFDGNNEGDHFSAAKMAIAEPYSFARLKDRELNAHWPVLEAHRRMLAVYRRERQRMKEVGPVWNGRMPFDALNAIFSAWLGR